MRASRLRLWAARTSTSVQSSARRAPARRPPPPGRRSPPRAARARSAAAASASARASASPASAPPRLRFARAAALLAAAQHLGPAAVVGAQLAVLDRERPLGDRVEQRAVVRDEQHGARERVERRLERLAALEVEVVRRLVEDEEVRAGRHGHARARAAAARRPRGRRPASRARPSRRRGSVRAAPARPAARGPSSSGRTGGRCRACRAPSPAARSTPDLDAVAEPDAAAPLRASRRPSTIVSSSVVLPLPFGPTSATCSPRSSAKEAPRSSVRPPIATSSPSASTTSGRCAPA